MKTASFLSPAQVRVIIITWSLKPVLPSSNSLSDSSTTSHSTLSTQHGQMTRHGRNICSPIQYRSLEQQSCETYMYKDLYNFSEQSVLHFFLVLCDHVHQRINCHCSSKFTQQVAKMSSPQTCSSHLPSLD